MKHAAVLAALFAQTAALAQTASVTPSTVTTPSFRAQRGSALLSVHADLPACYGAIVADVLARRANGTYSCRMLGGSSGTARWDFYGTYTPAAPPPPPPASLGTWTVATSGLQNPQFAPGVAPNAAGVSFYRNGVFNRTDATGPAQGSVYEMYPAITLVAGDVLRADWHDAAGTPYSAAFTVGGTAPPPPPPATTGIAVLSWDASLDSRTIGYRVYWGTAPGTYSQAYGFGALTSQTTYTATLAAGARYYFTVTAIGEGIESGPASEVSKALP
jgi:hypothetical protein